MLSTLLLCCAVGLATTVPTTPVDEVTPRAGEKCGYDSCADASPDALNVHIVAHTHDELGWLKTIDQYYYGSRNKIQKAGVKYILDSVVKELWEDPKRRFIYADTAFFWKWWVAQPDAVKSRVHTLVRQGRLQFVGGAWSMNDEATTHYQSTIDQFTWGLSKLNATFGECGRPAVGWQIDPFGHSREFAAALAAMGYDGLFLGRLDFQDKARRLRDRALEMLWRGSDELGRPSDIFTSVLYNTYSPPPGFCFDVLCDDEPIIEDPDSPMYNVEKRVTGFLEYVSEEAKHYRTDNVIVTMGGDFAYQDAFMWFDNLDKLIKYTNLKASKEDLKIKVFYSTPQCYLKAVKDANPTLPTKQDDFFPYASDPTAYWTGYYTSRPTMKFMERQGNNFLQTFKMLQVLADLPKSNIPLLNDLKSAMGIMQHHEAITGTERQHVVHDYERIVSRAVDGAYTVASQAFNKLTKSEVSLSYQRCEFNQSQCAVSEESKTFVVTFYNNQVLPQNMYIVEIPVVFANYSVYNASGDKLKSVLTPLLPPYFQMPTRKSKATHSLCFQVDLIPGLGLKTFFVKREEYGKQNIDPNKKREYENNTNLNDYWTDDSYNTEEMRGLPDEPVAAEQLQDIVLENEFITLTMDKRTGWMKYFSKSDGTTTRVSSNIATYYAFEGDNMVPANRSSGAYVFRPNLTSLLELKTFENYNNIKVTKSPIKQEITVQYDEFATSVIGIEGELVYIDNILAPPEGVEYVMRVISDMEHDGVFYTDSNGRQMLKRIRDKRPQWNLTLAEPIPGNYYPVVNEIYIEDDDLRVIMNVDRARGGTSWRDGSIEFMLMRRLTHDDGIGVGEALNEIAGGLPLYSCDSSILQIVPKTKDKLLRAAEISHAFFSPVQLFVADANGLSLDKFKKMNNHYSLLKTNLTRGVHLLTLEPWLDGQILIRIENYLEKSLSPEHISVDLSTIFKTIEIKSVKETTLAANQWLSDYKQWEWDMEYEFSRNFNEEYGGGDVERAREEKEVFDDGLIIKLKPKQIRTFIADYKVVS